jgi:hypothetical protein
MEFKKIHTDIIDSFAKFNITLESSRNSTKGIKVIEKFGQYVVEKNSYELFEGDADKENQARVKVNRNLLWINAKKGFFAQLLAKLNIYGSSDPRYTTMCTNGLNIQYHPDFVLSQSDAAIRFVLCHEILHCVGDHMTRRGSRNPLLWNYAADYAINPILNEEVVPGQFEWPKQPDGSRMGLYEDKYVGMRAEDIYDLLIDDREQQKKATDDSGEDPEGGTHVIDSDEELAPPDSPESVVQEVSEEEEEWEEEEEGEEEEEEEEGRSPAVYGEPGDIIGIKRGPNRGYAKIVSVNEVTGEHVITVLSKEEASRELSNSVTNTVYYIKESNSTVTTILNPEDYDIYKLEQEGGGPGGGPGGPPIPKNIKGIPRKGPKKTGKKEGPEGPKKPGGPGGPEGPKKPGGPEGPKKPGEQEGPEGPADQNLIGKRVRITTGPNTGKIGTIKSVLPNGDIIIE